MDISSMLEVQVNEYKEGESKENLTPIEVAAPAIPTYEDISQDEEQFFQLMFDGDIASIRFRKLHCTACDVHIGSAPSSATNMFEHPVLRTLLCARCHEFYGDGTFEQGDDETDMFCRWCANGGNLYCCATCSNTFCYKCIKRNFDPSIRKKIEADEKWRCFVCDPTDLYPLRSMCRAVIQHVQTVTRLLQMNKAMSPKEIEEKMNLDESPCCPRKRKRRRRRTGSNSEEEDESYMPSEIDTSILPVKRRRTRRSQNLYTNGDADEDEEVSEKGVSPKIEMDDTPSPAIHCEQSMIESENEIVAPDGKIIRTTVSQASILKSQPRLPMLSTYKKVVPIPTAHLMKTSPVFQSRKFKMNNILNPRIPQIIRGPRPHPTPPMVSIPARPNILERKVRPKVLLPRPRMILNTSNKLSAATNVINLDSDDEDLVIIDSNKNSKNEAEKSKKSLNNGKEPQKTQSQSQIQATNEAVREKSPERFSLNTQSISTSDGNSFKQLLVQKNREIDTVLNTMKFNLKKIVNDPSVNYEDDAQVAKRVKNIYKNIYRSITKFAEQSDAITYAYDRWNESRNRTKTPSIEDNSLQLSNTSNEELLEMACFNESEEENDEKDVTDDGNESKISFIVASSLSSKKRTSMFDNFGFFRKRHIKDTGVGETDLSVRSIGVQQEHIEHRDMEECIGYALVTKVSNQSTTSSEPPVVPNKHHEQYFEQFVYFLQHIENHGIETEDERGLKSKMKVEELDEDDVEMIEFDSAKNIEKEPAEEKGIDEESMEEEPIKEKLVDEKSTEENPGEKESTNTNLVEEKLTEEVPMEVKSIEENSAEGEIAEDDCTEPLSEKASSIAELEDENDAASPSDSKEAAETTTAKTLPDPNETPLKDLIEANSPFISEMLRSISTPVLTNGSCPTEPAKSQSEDQSTMNSRAVDDLAEMVTKLSNDIDKEPKSDDIVNAVEVVIDEDVSTKKSSVAISDDECTSID